MSRRKKICLVIPSLGSGGMERVMSILAEYFDKKKKSEVHLVLYGRERDVFYSIPETVVVHKPNFKFENSKRTWHTFKTLFFLRNCIRSIEPHSILSFGEYWNNLFLLSSIGLNIPKYVADRAEPGLEKGKFQEFLCRWLYPQAAGVVVQTRVAKKIYEDKYKWTEISVIGNPVNKMKSEKEVQKENAILSVGRLVDTKNFDLLIRIFHRLKVPDWKLYIVGGNSQKQNGMKKLEQLITELNLEDKVLLMGTVPHVEEFYQKSKIFAFTSSSEGFPNVLAEAMASGLPVISFDCIAGPSELIDDGENGFLIPLFDTETFEEKLRRLVKDPELRKRMGCNSQKLIENYSIETIGEKFYSLITQ
ncbi:glycosyltransferase family 4 protein [Aliifodinibius sp. S!AR15-10]|uniref:glycosyltransferase family 4 protein n=1 Tax=Aliifodinibius sp. S!AR15-10 TaxID=2950437 RepID=UPI002856C186|nr:glycosyltransferase family 4 protein [Aliifodinibius sp. S!AR15-10]MDR8390257.1 glycosyltransferase family 4 protein [Aliifodinibius sp. S!AR15-10]